MVSYSAKPRCLGAKKTLAANNPTRPNIVVDTGGLLLQAVVHEASIQDQDGAVTVFKQVRRLFPFLELIWADGGYTGPKLAKQF